MAARGKGSEVDRELLSVPQHERWRQWMLRIEAVLFASASPVDRADLERVVGQGASVALLIADLANEYTDRAFEVARVGGGWMLRTRPAYAPAIRASAHRAETPALSDFDVAVLAAIAYHQPISRHGLKDIFGKEISRELIGRLSEQALIATGPREPRRGAPYTFVTTKAFLATFCLESLEDLPDREQLDDSGLVSKPRSNDLEFDSGEDPA